MAESAEGDFVGNSEVVNTQKCWVVPTKYSLKWTVENMLALGIDKVESPILKGSADTSFQLELELFQDSIYVKMKCHSTRTPLKVKGEIAVQYSSEKALGDHSPFEMQFKKGKEFRTISTSYAGMDKGFDLFLHCEFIAFSGSTKHQKLARSEDYYDLQETRKFGDSLLDFRKDSFLTDTFLLVNAEKLPVHRLVLNARCPKMLNCVEKTDTILNQCDKEVVERLLEYIYTGNPHELIDKSRCFPVLKSITKLGLEFQVPAIEYLFEVRDFEFTTRCHRCTTLFNWVISGSEILKLKANDKITSTKFEFCSTSCHLLLSKESIKGEKENAEAVQKLGVSLCSNNVIKNLEGNFILLDSRENKLDIIKGIKATVRKESDINFFSQFLLDKQCSGELFIIRCSLKHKTLDNSIKVNIGTFDGIRYAYDRAHIDEFYKSLESMHVNNGFADLKVTVRCENNFSQCEVHKIVFSARSPKFKRMISSGGSNEIEINVLPSVYHCFHRIIKYFYTGEIDFFTVLPQDAYRFAHEYEIMDLLWRARKVLSGHWLNEENAAIAMTVAVDCEDEFLKKTIKEKMYCSHKKWNSEKKVFEECYRYSVDSLHHDLKRTSGSDAESAVDSG